jgi:ABC-type branched-subunit amino acid transport system ATPase component/ABC-type branched-subunit amino acid transport system permease subunit
MDVLRFALLGLGAGAAYALLGQGIVVIYRGSGLLNFAQGGIAMVSAQIFYGLRNAHHLPATVAMLVSLSVAAGIGAAMQLVVLRQLKNASALARMMSTLALLGVTVGVGTVAWNANGLSAGSVVTGILPTGTFNFGDGLVIGQDRIVLLGLAIALTIGCWQLYQRTRYGLATSAVAENQQAAVVLGWSSDVIATINWVIGSVLAGIAGVLLAPIAGLSVTALVLTVIPGLAAALVGQFSSFWLVLAGGLGLGVLQAEMERYVQAAGWADAVPFLVVIALVVLRGRPLPVRGDPLDRPILVGSGRIRLGVVVPAVVVTAVVVGSLSGSWALAASSSFLMGIVALSIVLLTGYAGQISLTQVTIAGIGAITAGNLSNHFGISFVPAVVIGTACAGIVGVLVGMPALRCRGVNLAVVTLGLSLVIEEVVLGNEHLNGGLTGVLTVASPRLFGIPLDQLHHSAEFAILTMLFFVVCAIAVANIRRGPTGRRLLALRSNERAAATSGVQVFGSKLYAFGLAAMLAGFAGALGAFQLPVVALGGYTTVGSIFAVLGTAIGGIGYIFGAILGGLTTTNGGIIQQWLSHFSGSVAEYLALASAVGSLQVIMFAPSGLGNLIAQKIDLRRWTLSRRQPKGSASTTPPPSGPDGTPTLALGRSLRVRELSVRFGGVEAVSGVSLDVDPGEVVGLIGPNGAGKTTILDAISGLVSASGYVTIGGVSIDKLSARQRTLQGIGRTYQAVELFDDMSVIENIRVAAESRGVLCYMRDLVLPRSRPLPAVAQIAISDLDLSDELDRSAQDLSTGRRSMVGIARMLASSPGVVLLDEPAAGLNYEEKEELARLVRYLADKWRLSVLLIEHDVAFVTEVSNRVIALSLGQVIAEGSADEVLTDQAVVTSYLGTSEESDGGLDVAITSLEVPR